MNPQHQRDDKMLCSSSPDLLGVFLCYVEWRDRRTLTACHNLLAALYHNDEVVRAVASTLLRRSNSEPSQTTDEPEKGKNEPIANNDR